MKRLHRMDRERERSRCGEVRGGDVIGRRSNNVYKAVWGLCEGGGKGVGVGGGGG